MALRDLAASGADCGPVNPLAGLSKHFETDRSLQRGTHDDAGPAGRAPGLRGSELLSARAQQQQQRSFEDEFFAQAGPATARQQLPREHGPRHATAGLGRLDRFGREGGAGAGHFGLHGCGDPIVLADDWSHEFMRDGQVLPPSAHLTDEEMSRFEAAYQHGDHWADQYARHEGPIQTRMHPSGITEADMERIYNEAAAAATSASKPAPTADDWVSEFAQDRADAWVDEFMHKEIGHTNETMVQTATSLVEFAAQDERMKRSKFMQFMEQISTGQVHIADNKVVMGPTAAAAVASGSGASDLEWAREFADPTAATRPAVVPSSSELIDEFQRFGVHDSDDAEHMARVWENEYALSQGDHAQSLADGQTFPEDELQQFQEAFSRATRGQTFEEWTKMYNENVASLRDSADADWERLEKGWHKYAHEGWGYEGYNREMYATYVFTPNNPFSTSSDPLADARRLQKQHRHVEASLALEEEVQRHPDNAEAWLSLGQAQAINEKDVLAVAALQKALQLNPQQLEGFIHLAVSYTNENCRPEAFTGLENFLRNHPKYAPIMARPVAQPNRHVELVSRFVEAARMNPHNIDADVQIGLAILFNISGEYEKAVDCLHAALSVRADDAMLWNRLGATLANSGQPERAVDAYHKALDRNPAFVRALYNLGISCVGMGAHREAVEHFLTALSLQVHAAQLTGANADPSQTSSNIWESLQMVFLMMKRDDLAARCDQRDINAFRPEFDHNQSSLS